MSKLLYSSLERVDRAEVPEGRPGIPYHLTSTGKLPYRPSTLPREERHRVGVVSVRYHSVSTCMQ